MAATARTPPGNRLLQTLTASENRRLRDDLEPVSLGLKAALYRPGQAIAHVYFPINGAISVLAGMADGTKVEVSVVGREGMVGVPVFLGAETTLCHYIVQVPVLALRMGADVCRARFSERGPLHRLLLRYTNLFLTHLTQSIACNSLHSIEQRCCRWLLMTRARAGTDQFPLTHDFLATMLGVRRASVTEVARGLQEAGLIRYERGRLAVLNPKGLAAAACECYRVVQAETERFFA